MWCLKRRLLKSEYVCFSQNVINSKPPIASLSSRDENDLVRIDDTNNSFRKLIMIKENQRNSLGLKMIQTLQKGIDTINLEKCRALVISSSSKNIFSSGRENKEKEGLKTCSF